MFIKKAAILLLLVGRDGAAAARHRKRHNNNNEAQESTLDNNEAQESILDEDMIFLMRKLQQSMSIPAANLPIPSPTPPPATPAPTFPCNLTPQERATEFRKMALKITPAATLNNSNSPQSKALRWLSVEDEMSPTLCPGDGEVQQRYIMAAFYFATGGGTWTECNAPTGSSQSAIDAANQKCTIVATKYPVKPDRTPGTDAWLTSVPVCRWGGLTCHSDDRRGGTLDQIDIEKNNLSGSLIDEIGDLPNLRFLILEQGNIGGNIPESIGNLPLLIVDFDYNKFTGPIPQSLYNVRSLQQLDLNDNQMTGTISSNVANWNRMTFLQLNNNSFNGNIPPQVGSLNRLSEYTHI